MPRVTIFLLFALFTHTAAADPAVPATQASRIESLTDLRSNAVLVRDPRQALAMADAMSEPEYLIAAMAMSARPELWLKMLERAGAPEAPANVANMADPTVLTDWFYSSIDPEFQRAIVSRMLDPDKSRRWMQAMADPRFYMHALSWMNPATPMQWMKVTADGRMTAPMRPWFDPRTYFNWMRLPASVSAGIPGRKNDSLQRSAMPQKPPLRY